MKTVKRIVKWLLILLFSLLVLLGLPRIWSAINPNEPPVGYHFLLPAYAALGLGFEKLADLTPAVPENIREIKNIEYKNVQGESLCLDMYIPDSVKKPAPLLVFIHGGSWRSGKRSDYLVYLLAFAQKGYITATVSYRLLKVAPYPASAMDVSDALEWFFKNDTTYGYDKSRIALIGGSAGAHLALLAAYGWKYHQPSPDSLPEASFRPKVKAVVDIYGPADLTTPYAQHQPLVTDYLAHSYQEAPDLFREASPVNYLSKDVPPTMILHGTSDDLVPVSQSDTLKARLDRLGVPVVYYRVPLWPHAMDVVKRVNDFSREKMSLFFEEYLAK